MEIPDLSTVFEKFPGPPITILPLTTFSASAIIKQEHKKIRSDFPVNELLQILNENCPGIDFEGQTRLIDDGILDSLNIVMLVGELNDAFHISIGADDLTPENFNSLQAIYSLVQRLANE